MTMELGLSSPYKNAAQGVKLADTIPKPFDPSSLPHDFTLKCWYLELIPTQVFKVRRNPEGVGFDSVYVHIHGLLRVILSDAVRTSTWSLGKNITVRV